MAIEYASSIRDAKERLTAFLIDHGSELPDWTRGKVLAAASEPSPVNCIVNAGEALYAALPAISSTAREICAMLVQFAASQPWRGLDRDGRGSGIIAACRRENGEASPAGGWPDPSADPAPDARLVEPAPDPAPDEEEG